MSGITRISWTKEGTSCSSHTWAVILSVLAIGSKS
jgi:hypothetical protein